MIKEQKVIFGLWYYVDVSLHSFVYVAQFIDVLVAHTISSLFIFGLVDKLECYSDADLYCSSCSKGELVPSTMARADHHDVGILQVTLIIIAGVVTLPSGLQ